MLQRIIAGTAGIAFLAAFFAIVWLLFSGFLQFVLEWHLLVQSAFW